MRLTGTTQPMRKRKTRVEQAATLPTSPEPPGALARSLQVARVEMGPVVCHKSLRCLGTGTDPPPRSFGPRTLPGKPTQDGQVTRPLVCCISWRGGWNLHRCVSLLPVLASSALINSNSHTEANVVTNVTRHQVRVKTWLEAVTLYNELYRQCKIVRVRG